MLIDCSLSGATSTSARPATSDVIFFIAAASRLTALSNASGPSNKPPAIRPLSVILQRAAASTGEPHQQPRLLRLRRTDGLPRLALRRPPLLVQSVILNYSSPALSYTDSCVPAPGMPSRKSLTQTEDWLRFICPAICRWARADIVRCRKLSDFDFHRLNASRLFCGDCCIN